MMAHEQWSACCRCGLQPTLMGRRTEADGAAKDPLFACGKNQLHVAAIHHRHPPTNPNNHGGIPIFLKIFIFHYWDGIAGNYSIRPFLRNKPPPPRVHVRVKLSTIFLPYMIGPANRGTCCPAINTELVLGQSP